MSAIETLGTTLGTKIDAMGTTLGTKIDTLGTKIDAMGSGLSTKMDAMITSISGASYAGGKRPSCHSSYSRRRSQGYTRRRFYGSQL